MFKKTDPQQNLFGVESSMEEGLRARLSDSWAQVFRREVLPILMRSEKKFSVLYGATGRPNFSVGRVLGICLLQEWHDLSDQEALDTFGFDLRWRHALDVPEREAYLSRRSLVEFRRRLVAHDPEMKLVRGIFEEIGNAAIEKLGISTSQQRLDSTHIESNIRCRGRLALFQDTMHRFLRGLSPSDYARVPAHIRQWHETNPEGWFGLGESERKARLSALAKDLHTLIELFSKDEAVTGSAGYQLMVRLFREQCEIKAKAAPGEGNGDGEGGDGQQHEAGQEEISGGKQAEQNEAEIEFKKKIVGDHLQSAFDTDASYGHKGTGYSAHITETCSNGDKPEIITDYEVHGAHRSDMAKTKDVLERLEKAELAPKTLFADGGYPSVPSALEIVERGVELVAPVNRGRLGEDVMSREQFLFDADSHVIACPEGHRTIDHRILSADNGTERSLYAIFEGNLCRRCSKLERCPVRAPNHREKGCDPRETVGDFRLEITAALRLRDVMFERQKTRQWKDRYKIRSGVEATMSELKRLGLGKLRVRGLTKVVFVVACKVIACNIRRWWRAVIAATGGQNPLKGTGKAVSELFRALSGLMLTWLAAARLHDAISTFIEYIPRRKNDHTCMA